MPNWVSNMLTINAPSAKRIKEVLESIKGTDEHDNPLPISFNRIMPQNDEDPKYQFPDDDFDWYHWRLDNWGTKWEASNCDPPKIDENVATICFETPWNPPMPIFKLLCSLFLDCKFMLEWKDEAEDDWHCESMEDLSCKPNNASLIRAKFAHKGGKAFCNSRNPFF